MDISRSEAREWLIGGKDVCLTVVYVQHSTLTVVFIGKGTDIAEFEMLADVMTKRSVTHKWSVER
jgi:hypothetical protein